MESSSLLIGCDTGGTFTDFVMFDPVAPEKGLTTAKVSSTPDDPSRAILQGLKLLAGERGVDDLRHATTVATNALLENRLGCIAYLTTRGFGDTLWLGRGERDSLYSLRPGRVVPPLARERVFEVDERNSARGETLEPLCHEQRQRLREQLSALDDLQAVAVCLLHSSLCPDHELALGQALADQPCFLSHRVAPGPGEYERGMTTALAAALSPIISAYLERLEKAIQGSRLWVVHSAGGLLEPCHARDNPHLLALSGPAAGLRGALALAQSQQTDNIISLDIGGTSSDVALCHDGELPYIWETEIQGYPLRAPSLEIHTIGSGGGSIAYRDQGGLLRVGPHSAGAAPGPACYGQGGQLPTVTDALCWAGYLPTHLGALQLDRAASQRALQSLASELGLGLDETALGILEVTVGHLGLAVRAVSTKRGHDPQDFVLLPFGGAGPMLACQVADALEIERILVPQNAGVLSAWGALTAPAEREWAATLPVEGREDHKAVERALHSLAETIDPLAAAFTLEPLVARRYRGQGDTLTSPPGIDFHQLHQRHFGFSRPDSAVETVEVRWRARAQSSLPGGRHAETETQAWTHLETRRLLGQADPVAVFSGSLAPGQTEAGPFLTFLPSSTLLVSQGWTASSTPNGDLWLGRKR